MSDLDEREREARLLARAQSGDDDAWWDLLEPLYKRLLPMVQKVLKNDADVEDVIQSTLLEIYSKMDAYRGEARFSTYVWQAVKMRAFSHLKENLLHRKLLEQQADAVDSCRAPITPEQALLNSEQAHLVDRALSNLRPSDRDLLTEAVQDDGDAKPLRSPATAKKRVALHRARQRLKDNMEKLEGKEEDQ
ncbi:RNA polymerase sigma factor [Sorangium sp. So ce1097]|uniref:RNA polymerase sigma factor n=1 Tax=Sorangium sp. So ce1097 TaxID=3133330 RepID=UPI003F5FDE5D